MCFPNVVRKLKFETQQDLKVLTEQRKTEIVYSAKTLFVLDSEIVAFENIRSH